MMLERGCSLSCRLDAQGALSISRGSIGTQAGADQAEPLAQGGRTVNICGVATIT